MTVLGFNAKPKKLEADVKSSLSVFTQLTNPEPFHHLRLIMVLVDLSCRVYRGGVLEDVLGLEDVLEDTF